MKTSLPYLNIALLVAIFLITNKPAVAQSYNCATQTEVPAAECEALVALYNSTNGPKWKNNEGWLDPNTPIRQWNGVIVSGGSVIDLSLSRNELTGSIPATLGQLTNLEFLYLNNNDLSGSIPAELSQLSSLILLSLDDNDLSGSIPAELGRLANLQAFAIDYNQLSGPLPAELTALPLELFNFSKSDLCEPQDAAFQEWLDSIQGLQRTGVSCTGGTLSCAEQTEVPQAEYEALVALYNSTDGPNWERNRGWLSAPVSQWDGVVVVSCTVTLINLVFNKLSGTIPAELGQLTNLQELYLGRNALSGSIPVELGQLTNLQELHLWGNALSGSIPVELGQLTNLQRLFLFENNLNGTIPPELGQLTNLQELHLGSNNLSGSIPAELVQLTNLKNLHLGFNSLSGTIPAELVQLPNLQELHLGSNNLSGSIPPELGQLTNLKNLHLGSNSLSGSIPAEFRQLTNLRFLDFSENTLKGLIPLSFTNLTVLEQFYFNGTALCEPQDPTFQEWLGGIPDLLRTGVACSL